MTKLFGSIPSELKAVPAKKGSWKCRYYAWSHLFDENGRWLPGVDKFALPMPVKSK